MLAIVQRALAIKRNIGTRAAAGFLRNKGVTVQTAVFILATPAWSVEAQVAAHGARIGMP